MYKASVLAIGASFGFSCLALNPGLANAAILSKGYAGVLTAHVYEMTKDSPVLPAGASKLPYAASRGSKFDVLDCDSVQCIIQFTKLGSDSLIAEATAECTEARRANSPTATACNHVRFKEQYVVNRSLLPEHRYRDASGVMFGVLAVPYKVQLSKPRELTAGGTVGPVIGYRWVMNDKVSLVAPLLSLGLSFVAIGKPTQAGSAGATETKPALGAATGVVVEFSGACQVGAVIGVDAFVDEYAHNNKPWLALAVGYSFL